MVTLACSRSLTDLKNISDMLFEKAKGTLNMATLINRIINSIINKSFYIVLVIVIIIGGYAIWNYMLYLYLYHSKVCKYLKIILSIGFIVIVQNDKINLSLTVGINIHHMHLQDTWWR